MLDEREYLYKIGGRAFELAGLGADVVYDTYSPWLLRKMLKDEITDREREVLERRYRDGETLEQVGRGLGLTRERVRQIEGKAFAKLSNVRVLKDYAPVAFMELRKERRALEAMGRRMESLLASLGMIVRGYGCMVSGADSANAADSIAIEDLGLSARPYNCMKRRGIKTVGDLVLLSEIELMKTRSLGYKSKDEIVDKLRDLGLKLRSEGDADDS